MFLRALVVLVLGVLPSVAATFGTVVAHAQPLADLAIDEARKRLYVVNTASNLVEVYSTTSNPPRQTTTIRVDSTPLAIAISPSGKALYVACYAAAALDIIDLTSSSFATRSLPLTAGPQGVAVGFNETVLISTSGTTNGQNVLVTYDPAADASRALQSVVIAPPPPALPALPPPGGVMALASRVRLQVSQNGRTIIGVHQTTTTRTVFVFDVNSSTVLASRTVPAISSVLAVSPDGSRFMSGPTLFETSSMLVMAQQSTANSPFVFPAGANFNTQAAQGGAVYAQTSLGQVLITAYNIVPVAVPAARANTAQLLLNSPDNLLIQLGIQLPENLEGKMAITLDSSTIYAISQSGFMVLPIGTLTQLPLAMPDSNVALLAFDQCGVTAAQSSAVIPVRNIGGRTLTATAQVLTTAATSATLRVNGRPYGGDVTASFNSAAARAPGTVTPDQVLIQSSEAVNIVPTVRVFQNNRSPESRGAIVPVDTGAGSLGLTDMLADTARQRLYIANPGLNRVEVLDMQKQQLLAPIPVGQLPRSLALGSDGNTLYVANSGSEMISIVDLTKGTVTGRVNLPPIPFNAAFAIITPTLIASSQRGPQVVMSDASMWRVIGDTLLPRTLNPNIFGATTRNLPGPVQTMTATPDGAFVLILSGGGIAFLYDAGIDDFVSGRQVIATPITGYFGPISAGPNGQYFLVDDQVLNQALTPVGSSPAGGPTTVTRPVAAVTALGGNSFARFTMPQRASTTVVPTDAGVVEVVDATTLRTTSTANALEGPLSVVVGTVRANVNGRTMSLDPAGTTAFVLTTSGVSIVPLTGATSTQNAPQLSGNAVVNAATFTNGIAPGGLISILGRNLASSATADGTPLPTTLGGTCVTLNNVPLPLQATSATQINAQVPFTLAPGRYPLVVRSIANQAASGTANVSVSRYAPAIFFDAEGPAIFHQDGKRVNKDHPASRDEPLTIYATGLGVTTGGKVTTGLPSPSDPLAVTVPVQLYFGIPSIKEAAIIVDWSGLAPGMIGVYQISCRIPGTHIKGDALPVTVRIGGVSSVTTGPTAPVVYVN